MQKFPPTPCVCVSAMSETIVVHLPHLPRTGGWLGNQGSTDCSSIKIAVSRGAQWTILPFSVRVARGSSIAAR
jgi:hypothetical protein